MSVLWPICISFTFLGPNYVCYAENEAKDIQIIIILTNSGKVLVLRLSHFRLFLIEMVILLLKF